MKIERTNSISPNRKSPSGKSDSGSLSSVQRTSSSSNLVDMPVMQQMQAVQSAATGFLPVVHVDRDAFAQTPSSQDQKEIVVPESSLPGIGAPMPRRYQGYNYGSSFSASALRSQSLSGSSAGSSRSDSAEPSSRCGSRSAVRGTHIRTNASGNGRRFSESTVQPDSQHHGQTVPAPQKKHITFNPYVEQCIAQIGRAHV